MLRISAARLAQAFRSAGTRSLHTSLVAADAGDKILLRGLVFHGYHGVLEEERRLGQKFLIDATLSICLKKAGRTDDLEDTINYAEVYTDIKTIVEGKPYLLIETLAETIAQKILKTHKSVDSVHIRVEKPHVAVQGVVHSLGIEIMRDREQS